MPFGLTWEPGTFELLSAVVIGTGVFWLLRAFGQSHAAFWIIATVGVLAQTPSVLSHSVLDWGYFLSEESLFATSTSSFESTVLFLLSLVILVLLRNSAEIRDIQHVLVAQQAESSDTARLVIGRMLVSVALTVSCLMITLATLYLGTTIAGNARLFISSPWAVLTIGMGSIALIGALPLLWLGGRRED